MTSASAGTSFKVGMRVLLQRINDSSYGRKKFSPFAQIVRESKTLRFGYSSRKGAKFGIVVISTEGRNLS
jgi:hypothetical protein